MTLIVHEWRASRKSFYIWLGSIVVICFGCELLYGSLENSLQGMADAYQNMGTFSQAFGMDQMSIATMEGFYATEIALMFGLGAAMFAGMLGTAMLSKETEGHTAEFLYTLPNSRRKIVLLKYAAMILRILLFNVISVTFFFLGFLLMKEDVSIGGFFIYHIMCFLMQVEIATICFFISAISNKKNVGMGIGMVILCYALDMMCRLIPDLEKLKYVVPYYYANAVDLFENGMKGMESMTVIGVVVTIVCLFSAVIIYEKKDINP